MGDSSRNTKVAALINLAATTVTEQLSNQETDQKLTNELKSSASKFYNYKAQSAEIAKAPELSLNTTGFVAPNNASDDSQDVTVDSSSPYYSVDGGTISSVDTYVDPNQTDWEGTGAAYQAKTGETIKSATVVPSATLYDVAKGTVSLTNYVAGLSVTELANIVEGASNVVSSTDSAKGAAGYTTQLYEDDGIAVLTLADGPAGLRITQSWTDSTTSETYYQYGTAWPIGTALAQTWNTPLVTQVGEAIDAEMAEYGVSLWLAPGMNIHRDPLCGRNFEYYSEDPLVAGLNAAATTRGVQETPGVGVTAKHYAGNNQEVSRSTVNDTINERALREIYLKGFEIEVTSAQPMAIMSSYNKINGTYVAGDYDMLTDILRGEWDFKGLVMTDWGGVRAGIINCMYSGNDIIMPGGKPQAVITATVSGGVVGNMRLGDLQRSATKVLSIVKQSASFAQLAEQSGQTGITVKSYTAQFTNLAQYATASASAVSSAPNITSAAPTVAGSAQVGSTLVATPGAWTAGASFTYQWLRDGSVISGASAKTYKATTADIGKKISVKVTGSKTGFTSVTRTSASSTITKVKATVTAKLAKKTIKKGKKASVTVTVKAAGVVPTGTVTVTFGSKKVTKTLVKGKVKVTSPTLKKTGKVKIKVRYAGNAQVASATGKTLTVKVKK